jgi:hypothetical protein
VAVHNLTAVLAIAVAAVAAAPMGLTR